MSAIPSWAHELDSTHEENAENARDAGISGPRDGRETSSSSKRTVTPPQSGLGARTGEGGVRGGDMSARRWTRQPTRLAGRAGSAKGGAARMATCWDRANLSSIAESEHDGLPVRARLRVYSCERDGRRHEEVLNVENQA